MQIYALILDLANYILRRKFQHSKITKYRRPQQVQPQRGIFMRRCMQQKQPDL
jgi:hypothetical protein